MKSKIYLIFLSLLLILLTTGMSGGCGETTHESSAYYSPNWMPDGRIICYKVTSKWSNALWGRKELGDTDYITAMSVEGTNEVNLFENTFKSGGGDAVCSPTGERIAVYSPGYPEGIAIYDYSGNKTLILSGEHVDSADWSPDGSKLAYISSRKLYIVNADGTGNMQISSEASDPVSWRAGNIISYGYLFIIGADGTNNTKLVSGAYPQNYSSAEVVYLGADGVYKINTNGTGNSKLFSNYQRTTLKLSFDNTKIVGGDLIAGGGSHIGGIWITNISDGNSTKIR